MTTKEGQVRTGTEKSMGNEQQLKFPANET